MSDLECRVCGGGMLTVPDGDGESASDGDCAECDAPRVVCPAHSRSQSPPEVSRELADAMRETRAMRGLVDEATSAALARARQFLPAPLVKQLRSIRERAGLTP